MREKNQVIQELYNENMVDGQLFTVGQMKQASGFSRSMLIKLEEAGYITPRKTNEASGYRYYDAFNLGELAQYHNLREMGFSGKTILRYSKGEIEPEEMLEQIEARLRLVQRCADEFRMRLKKSDNFQFSIIHLPETTCFYRTTKAVNAQETAAFTYGVIHEAVFRGYRMCHSEPLFSIRYDTQTNPLGNAVVPYETTVCVPLDTGSLKGQADENVRTIPATDALSLLYYGSHEDSNSINYAHQLMWEEMERRGLSSADGSLRALGIVVPYYGMQIEPEDYVFRFAIPLLQGNAGADAELQQQ